MWLSRQGGEGGGGECVRLGRRLVPPGARVHGDRSHPHGAGTAAQHPATLKVNDTVDNIRNPIIL